MTLQDITYGVMAKQGADQGDVKAVRSMLERVRVAPLPPSGERDAAVAAGAGAGAGAVGVVGGGAAIADV